MDKDKFSEELQNFNDEFKLNKFFLNFLDTEIENEFRKQYLSKSLFSFRISFVVVIFLYAAFGLLDYTTSSKFYLDFFIVRYYVVIPFLVLVLMLSFHKIFVTIWQILLSICFFLSGMGIIYMLLKNPDNIFYYGGMFLIFMAGYFFIKLRFIYALVPALLLIVFYNIGAAVFQITFDTHFRHLISTNAFYISANIISMLALYNIEYLKRRDFFQGLLLLKSRENLSLVNLNLETQVKERTKLLAERNKSLTMEIKNRKVVENELIDAKDKAVESEKLKTAFLQNITREVRTTMNGILGFGELLENTKLSENKHQKYVDVIMFSGKRMINILNDLMDISVQETTQSNSKISTIKLNKELNNLYSFFKIESEQKGLQLLFDNSSSEKDLEIKTDKDKLLTVLSNLLKNSIKYSSEGRINFGYKFNDNYLEFYVKDQGIGIPKKQQSEIFNRYYQAAIKNIDVFDGTGLPLAVSKTFVEIMGGKIWVESMEYKGSEFYFTLPYLEPSNEVVNNENVISLKNEFLSKKMKILIAEDEAVADSFLTIVLKDISSELLHANNGKEALKICKQNKDIDLVLMDIKMPEMNGFDATREIRKFNDKVVIIAQTAYALSGDREKAINSGCNDYISKPLHLDKLMEMIVKHFKDPFIKQLV